MNENTETKKPTKPLHRYQPIEFSKYFNSPKSDDMNLLCLKIREREYDLSELKAALARASEVQK